MTHLIQEPSIEKNSNIETRIYHIMKLWEIRPDTVNCAFIVTDNKCD